MAKFMALPSIGNITYFHMPFVRINTYEMGPAAHQIMFSLYSLDHL
jgi:hypothetical protein